MLVLVCNKASRSLHNEVTLSTSGVESYVQLLLPLLLPFPIGYDPQAIMTNDNASLKDCMAKEGTSLTAVPPHHCVALGARMAYVLRFDFEIVPLPCLLFFFASLHK